MARAVSQMKWGDFNPRFFAYGQFPLYLAFFSAQLINFFKKSELGITFAQATYFLRFYSALFSLGTVGWGYLFLKKLEPKKKNAWLVVLWLFFSPGLIQAAHFGTTESLLSFMGLGLVYLSLEVLEKGLSKKNIWFIALLAGIGLGSKVSSAVFLLPVGMAFLLRFKKEKKKISYLGKGMGLGLLSLFFFLLFCPYYFLQWQEAWRIVNYEARVASGEEKVFYTHQFLSTFPFLFQLQRVLPWVLGGGVFSLFFPALGVNLFSLLKRKKKKKGGAGWWLFHLGWLPWFLLNSFLFTKWVRFMIPILPFFIILSFWLVSKIRNKAFFYLVLILGIFPGLLFSRIYFSKDIRVKTMEWLNDNLEEGAVILYEGGNIIDLPGIDPGKFKTTGFDFYSLEEREVNQQELGEKLSQADYFLSPSRRIFANHWEKEFPATALFYQRLFSGESGFEKVGEFKVFKDWEELLVGSDLGSEETWTVFDHPTLRLFKRVKN